MEQLINFNLKIRIRRSFTITVIHGLLTSATKTNEILTKMFNKND